uniref:Uncharacterized protein n=1 Tax=Vannella robusta TaxID=1487602 RepID=A0A7S4I7Q4_9EUKA
MRLFSFCMELQEAVVECKLDDVSRLLKESDPNYRNSAGKACLHVSMSSVITKLLLEHRNIDVNLRDNDGCTPLWWAARCNREEIVKILCDDPRTDVNTPDRRRRTPLIAAVTRGANDAVLELMKSPRLLVTKAFGHRSIVDLACDYGDHSVEVVKTLLAHPSLANDESCRPTLLQASRSIQLTRLFLQQGITTKIDDAIFVASECKTEEVFMELLKSDHKSLCNSKSQTLASYCSAPWFNEDVATQLIERGCNVNTILSGGKTALSFAIEANNISAVKFLLAQDILTVVNGNDSVMKRIGEACSKKQLDEEIVSFIINDGRINLMQNEDFMASFVFCNPLPPWFIRLAEESPGIVNMEITSSYEGARVITRNSTLLFKVCSVGNVDFVRFLVQQPALDYNCKISGLNVLHHLCQIDAISITPEQIREMVHLILQTSLDPNEECQHGTPLEMAIQYKKAEIIEELLQDPRVDPGEKGGKLLIKACNRNWETIYPLLCDDRIEVTLEEARTCLGFVLRSPGKDLREFAYQLCLKKCVNADELLVGEYEFLMEAIQTIASNKSAKSARKA